MKKKIVAFLLAGILAFTGSAEGISATEFSNTQTKEMSTEAETEGTETEEAVTEGTETEEAVTEGTETEEAVTEGTESTEGETEETGSTESEEAETGEEIDPLGSEETELKTGYQQGIVIEIPLEELPEIYEPPVESVGTESAEIKGSAIYHSNSNWDSYSTNYYYNLLNESQREFWDQLDEMCYGYLTGTESMQGGLQNYHKDEVNINYYETKAIAYINMSKEAASEVIMLFKLSNPQYYFLQSLWATAPVTTEFGYAVLTCYEAFGNGNARARETAAFKAKIDSWMAQINAQPNALLKEKKAHDLICENMIYDPGYEDPSIGQDEYNQSAWGVFMRDRTVCAGYSQAMELLCNGAGIDCAVVTSYEHEWNTIRLNGTWYYVDVTWDDNIADMNGVNATYLYFNRSKANFMQDDASSVIMHTVENFWNKYLPALNHDSGATYTNYGTIYAPTTTLAAPQVSASGNKITINAPSGGTIYYTTDGTTPSIANTKATKYTGTITFSKVTNVRAIAVADGCYDSGVSAYTAVPRYTVTFNANGGYIGKTSVKKKTKTVTYGNIYGSLSTPKRKGYAFLGWYTKKSGGSQITKSTKVTISSNKTYYAHWAKINPKKTSISSLTSSKSGQMKIKIKKSSTASGYQIRYSLKSNMSSSKQKTLSENSATITKLKKGKKYYVQVRTYQKESVSGKKKYGTWSKAKSVKIKK